MIRAFGLARAEGRSVPDRLEADAFEFHEAVRDGFLALAAADPERYLVLDADRRPGGGRGRGAGGARGAGRMNLSASRDMTAWPYGRPRWTQDEVDGIVAAWRRERPDLDVEPLQVLSRLDRLAGVLGERRAAIFARHDLRRHEFDVLAALRRAG